MHFSICFCTYWWIEHSHQLLIGQVVIALSFWTKCEMPIQLQYGFRNSRKWHISFHRNTLDYTQAFLSTRMRLSLGLQIFIYHSFCSFNASNWKSSLIHVIHILNRDLIFHNCLLKFVKLCINFCFGDFFNSRYFDYTTDCCL